MRKYTQEQKQQILAEVKETGNLTLVARKSKIPNSTIHTWLKKQNNNDAIPTDMAKFKQLRKQLSDKDLEIQILRDLLKKTYQVWPKD